LIKRNKEVKTETETLENDTYLPEIEMMDLEERSSNSLKKAKERFTNPKS